MKRIVIFFVMCLFFGSCALLQKTVPPVGVARTGNFTVTVAQCTANAGTQEMTVVVMITNTGPNDQKWVGGSNDGTMAVDVRGNTLKPYTSAGWLHEFPTRVPVRVTIERFGPIVPGTAMLRTLRVSIGSNSNIVEFRNVPVNW